MYKNYIFDLYGTLVDIRTNEGKPYVYASNDTKDMKHNGNALSNVIEKINEDITNTINKTNEFANSINALIEKTNKHDNDIELANVNINDNKTEIAILKNEMNGLKNEISTLKDNFSKLEENINANITNQLNSMLSVINSLQSDLNTTKSNLANTETELQQLKEKAITGINGVSNEITVTIQDNTATVGFASDAYFVAG